MRGLVGKLRDVLTELATFNPTKQSDDDVHAVLPELLTAINQLDAVTAITLASFDTRQLAERDGFQATRTWLTAYGRLSQGAASGLLTRGRTLRQLPALAADAGAGRVSAEQVSIVAKLAGAVGLANVARFDQVLADLASSAAPAEVSRACERIHAHLDPDGAAPDPNDAFDRRDLTLARAGTMTYLKGRLDPEGAALVHTVLDSFMRPPTGEDLRTPGQRRADAWIEACRTLLTRGDTPTVCGVRPHLGILITPSALLSGSTSQDIGEHNGHNSEIDGADERDRCTGVSGSANGDNVGGSDGTHCCEGDGNEGTGDDAYGDAGNGCQDGKHPPPRRPDALERLGVPQLPELPWAHWVGEVPPELAQRIACDGEAWRAISTRPPACRSRSGVPIASCQRGYARRSTRAIADAAGPPAPRQPRGPTRITSCRGGSAAGPMWITSCCSADITTARSMRDGGALRSTQRPERSTSTGPTVDPMNSVLAVPGSVPAGKLIRARRRSATRRPPRGDGRVFAPHHATARTSGRGRRWAAHCQRP